MPKPSFRAARWDNDRMEKLKEIARRRKRANARPLALKSEVYEGFL